MTQASNRTTPTQMSRRTILGGALAAGVAPLFGRAAMAQEQACTNVPAIPAIKARAERAVSLRRLSEALAAGKPARFEGLTRLEGYITDKENRDIILWGLAEKGQPELQVSDFVIALRSAHNRYLEKRDGVNYFINPIISIDPDPAVFRELNTIKTGAGFRRAYTELCKSPQKVRVEGMPRHTRVAKVLVDADYRMKQVGQGTMKLPISSPFLGDTDVQFAQWREDAAAGRTGSHVNTRYWFQAGRFTYQSSEGADTVFVDRAQVVLNDENQMLTKEGLVPSGKVASHSRAFTCAWTERMEDTYKAEPVWRDMHNIFRHFALARILRDRNALSEVGFAEEFLLDKFEIPHVGLPDTLPGLSRIDEYQVKRGGSKYNHSSSVCGGVSVGFNKPLEQSPDTGQAKASNRDVIASRPAPTTVAWAVAPGAIRGVFDGPSKPNPASTPAPKPVEPKAAPEPAKRSLQDLFKT